MYLPFGRHINKNGCVSGDGISYCARYVSSEHANLVTFFFKYYAFNTPNISVQQIKITTFDPSVMTEQI